MKNILSIMVCLLMAYSAHAQKVWTLEACINTAIESSLEIEGANLNVDFAEIATRQAEHQRYPSLSVGTGANYNLGRSINPITNQFENQSFISNNYQLSSNVLIFNGFRLRNTLEQSKVNRDAAKYDVDQMQRDVALTVANSYLNALFAKEQLKIAQSQLDVSKKQLERTQQLVNAGSTPANEVLNVQAQVSSNEQAVINAQNSSITSLLQLKQIMRLPMDEAIDVVEPNNITVLLDPDQLNVMDLYKEAYKNQPSMKALELRKKSAEMGVDIASAGLLPTVSAGGSMSTNYSNRTVPGFYDGYADQLNKNLGYGLGVSLNYPIYQNLQNKLGIERAKLNVLQVENNNARTENTFQTRIQQALIDARASKRKLAAAEQNVSAQSAAFDNAKRRYELGAIDAFQYTTLQNNLTQAQVNALIAKYEYVFAAKVIDFYMGKPITLN